MANYVGFKRLANWDFYAIVLLGNFIILDFNFWSYLEESLAFSWIIPLYLFHFSISSWFLELLSITNLKTFSTSSWSLLLTRIPLNSYTILNISSSWDTGDYLNLWIGLLG